MTSAGSGARRGKHCWGRLRWPQAVPRDPGRSTAKAGSRSCKDRATIEALLGPARKSRDDRETLEALLEKAMINHGIAAVELEAPLGPANIGQDRATSEALQGSAGWGQDRATLEALLEPAGRGQDMAMVEALLQPAMPSGRKCLLWRHSCV